MDDGPTVTPGADLVIGFTLSVLCEDARSVDVVAKRPVGVLFSDAVVGRDLVRRAMHRLARAGVAEHHRSPLSLRPALYGSEVGHVFDRDLVRES